MFILDDGAPHGVCFVCKRWYQKQMAEYLHNSTVFETPTEGPSEVLARLTAFNKKWNFATGTGIVYNYGVWKLVKQKFRFIAGCRSPKPAPGSEKSGSCKNCVAPLLCCIGGPAGPFCVTARWVG